MKLRALLRFSRATKFSAAPCRRAERIPNAGHKYAAFIKHIQPCLRRAVRAGNASRHSGWNLTIRIKQGCRTAYCRERHPRGLCLGQAKRRATRSHRINETRNKCRAGA